LPDRDIFVIGASADGVQTLKELVRPLPANLPAALFVVLHTGPAGASTYEDQARDLIARAHTIRHVLEQPIEHSVQEVEVPAGEGGEA